MKAKGTTRAAGRKHALDKFYTNPAIAKQCIQRLGSLNSFDVIIEPSAGSGAFSSQLPSNKTIALDIAPENPAIVQGDWLTYIPPSATRLLVIGNPPFGLQSSLAFSFIRRAAELGADTIAFILPRAFHKDSMQARVPVEFVLIDEWMLPRDSFLLNGEAYNLPAVYQVWRRSPQPRKQEKKRTTSELFSFVKQTQPFDFAVRRVGGKAGYAFIPNGKVSNETNYFICIETDDSVQSIIDMLHEQDYSVAESGTGPRSLSKAELVSIYENGYATR